MREYVVITEDDPRIPKYTTMIYTSYLPFFAVRRMDVFLNWFTYKFKLIGWMRSSPKCSYLMPLVDFIRGILSGIPICCILYFIKTVTIYGDFMEPRYDSQAGYEAGYRLCPKCARTGNYTPEDKLPKYLVEYKYPDFEIS